MVVPRVRKYARADTAIRARPILDDDRFAPTLGKALRVKTRGRTS